MSSGSSSSSAGGGGGAGGGKEKQTGKIVIEGVEYDREEERKARLLYDYDAEDDSQISLAADQVRPLFFF